MKKTLRIFSLMLAMLMTLTAFVGVLPAYAVEEPTNDAEAINAGYACKIVDANGNLVKYYKYFTPIDIVGTQSAYKSENPSSKDAMKALSAVQSVTNGQEIVLLKDVTMKVDSTYGNPNTDAIGKNVQGSSCYIRTNSAGFTVNGNGKTLTSQGGFIATSYDLTVKNLNFVLNGTECFGHARAGHTLTFEHCDFTIAGVRPADKKDGYFVFNGSASGKMVLSDCTVSIQKGIVPELPLFFSGQANTSLTLHNVTADYSKCYASAEATEATAMTVSAIVAGNTYNTGGSVTASATNMNIALSGNTSIKAGVKTIELQHGGTVVMNDNATVECVSTGSSASGNAGIHAYGSASFALTMNDNSKVLSVSGGKNAGISATCTTSNKIVLNENASASGFQSIRVDTAPAVIYLNDAADLTPDWATEDTGAVPIYVNGENKNCQVYVNADATVGSNSYSPYTYDTGISMIEGKEGLRFDSRIALARVATLDGEDYKLNSNIIGFGTLIAKHGTVLGLNDFTHAELDAAEAKYIDVKATLENCLMMKLKEDGAVQCLFGATLTGIKEANYNTQYAARSYVKCTIGSTAEDSNSFICYYSYYNTFDESADNNSSYAYTAHEAVNDTKATAETLSDTVDINGDGFYIYNVAEAGETAKYSRYTKAQYDKLLEIAESYNPVYVNATNRDDYAETTKVGDVNVHEVVIGEAGDGKTETTVVQITDLHFNSEDTNNWPLNNVEVTNAQASLAWAKANGQQIVITGDLFNEYSAGNMALVNQYVWNEIYKNMTMITLGNHDLIDTEDGDPVLAQDWAKLYQSKVLNEKVMIIMLDNASSNDVCAFTDEQYGLLAADLATARAEDYDVLLFYHIPLPTASFADAANQRLDANGDENNVMFNLYAPSNSNYKKWREDYATQNVYKLITDNADIIDAAFCGHKHVNQYSEIQGKGGNVIPQYTLIANAYEIGGSVTKITVYS